jgi:hypothetical protein
MRQSEQNPSSIHTRTADQTPDSAAAESFTKTVIRHFFVPTILLLVIGIVHVSAFHSSGTVSPTAAVSAGHSDRPASINQASTAPAANANGEPAEPTARATRDPVAIDHAPVDATDDTPPDHRPVAESRTSGSRFSYRPRGPYAAHGVFPPDYSDRLTRQQRAYFEAMQARQQHRDRMQAYRNTIQRRIEHDREAILRRMQEIERNRLTWPDRRLNWMDPSGNPVGSPPPANTLSYIN